MTAEHWAILGTMLLAGLGGSLHCVGMCGPILAGLSAPMAGRATPLVEIAAHHLGRLWTYALLGLLAGTLGDGLRALFPGQRVVAALLGGFVVLGGLSMAASRGSWLDRWIGARVVGRLARWTGLRALQRTPGIAPRLLAGAVMGLMPCGMVWTMLLPAAAMPHPLAASVAMVAFGLGTLPALTAVVLGARHGSRLLQRRGRAALAAVMIVAGGWMLARAIALPAPGADGRAPTTAVAGACHAADR